MKKNKPLGKNKHSIQKASKNNPSKTSTKYKGSKTVDEMKNVMKDWHRPIYHSSSFTLAQPTQQTVEAKEDNKTMCRICQSMDDSVSNQQVTPCGCIGSLQYVHLQCLRQWRLMQKAKGVDVSLCELCKKPYNVQLLGETNVPTDNLLKMQEDLKRLVRSGIYLMLLVKTWKEDLATLNQSLPENSTSTSRNNSSSNTFFNSRGNDLNTLSSNGQTSNQTLSSYDSTVTLSHFFSDASNIRDSSQTVQITGQPISTSYSDDKTDHIVEEPQTFLGEKSDQAANQIKVRR